MTNFIHADVEVSQGVVFCIDGNSKITSSNGTFAEPKPNALSLPHISTCPGSTPACRKSCYVHGLKGAVPELYEAYAQNERALHACLMSDDSRGHTAAVLGLWIRNNCPGGFRWHVSGDVISLLHAHWIAEVSRWAKQLCWIYTRTLEAVPLLQHAPNLVVNVSADVDNYAAALACATKHGARLCYMCQDGHVPADLPPDSVIFPDYALRGRSLIHPTLHGWWQSLPNATRRQVCPADFFGQSEEHRCGTCRKCMQ